VGKALNESQKRALREKAKISTLSALQALGGEAQRSAIREWALAHGDFNPLELAAPPPDAVARKCPNLVEYELGWALTNLKRNGLVEKPKWGTWRLAGAAKEPASPRMAHPTSADRLAELQEMPYNQYLRTTEWGQARAAALLRAGHACSMDVNHTEGLEVHHRTYERRGAELPADLIVLCRACHRLHHREYGRPRRRQSRSTSPAQRSTGKLEARPTTKSGSQGRQSLLRRLLGKRGSASA
jgi:hypothetical protein